jgi:transketolase
MSPNDIKVLANNVRKHVVEMTSKGKTSHVASALSVVDILATLYGAVMRFDSKNPTWEGRDRLILSKGHAGSALYATLAELDFFPKEWLSTYVQNTSRLSGHVSHVGVPGVEFSTGSLGHGLGVACGMALADKLDGIQRRVFCVMSDGECDEGSVWEAALFASHHELSNLVAIIDYNKLQSLGSIAETLTLEPFAKKWESFGWMVVECDGHDVEVMTSELSMSNEEATRPFMLIAHTIKGKGVSFMEESVLWHYRSPQGDELDQAIHELNSYER